MVPFGWYWEILSSCLDFLKFYPIICFLLNIALSRDPLHSTEGIPSSLAWFSLLGSRYFLYEGSVRTVNRQGRICVLQGKGAVGLKDGENVRKRRNFAQSSGLPCLSVPLRCQNSFLTFPGRSLWSQTPLFP